MSTAIYFFVPGIPQTAGSKRAFPVKKNGVFTGKNIVVDANPRAKDWKARVAHAAEIAMAGRPPIVGPLEVSFTFTMPRIGAHFRSNGQLKENAPRYSIVRPDVLKLSRAVEDACIGICWRDDSQIAKEHLEKPYGDNPGVKVEIRPIGEIIKRFNEAGELAGEFKLA